jgi:hypothetical protein
MQVRHAVIFCFRARTYLSLVFKEYLLDHVFASLGLGKSSSVKHPVLLTGMKHLHQLLLLVETMQIRFGVAGWYGPLLWLTHRSFLSSVYFAAQKPSATRTTVAAVSDEVFAERRNYCSARCLIVCISEMSELLFEGYGVPSVCTCARDFKKNSHNHSGFCNLSNNYGCYCSESFIM